MKTPGIGDIIEVCFDKSHAPFQVMVAESHPENRFMKCVDQNGKPIQVANPNYSIFDKIDKENTGKNVSLFDGDRASIINPIDKKRIDGFIAGKSGKDDYFFWKDDGDMILVHYKDVSIYSAI
jgi:hypothetical protein